MIHRQFHRSRAWAVMASLLFTIAAPRALELKNTDLGVAGYVDGGQFRLADTAVNKEIVNRMGARWRLERAWENHWSALATLHWMFWRNQATDLALFHVAGIKFNSDLEGMITWQDGSHRFRGGLYEFKYNPDSKNLGEYLLRSEAYPTIVENSQGKDLLAYSMSRVMGVEYALGLSAFRQTALLYAEQFQMPVNDINAVYLAEVGPENMAIGGGISFHRFLEQGEKINDNVLNPALRQYVKDNGLTTSAVKLMVRGRLALGPEFKLYGEAALLGLKQDTLYYRNIMDRVPMMLGLDLPTGGLLTTLSFEGEYFKNPYYGRKYARKDATGSNFSPLPFIDDYAAANLPDYTRDDFKWSFFAHKALNKWIDVKLRVASDHLRLLNWDGDYEGGDPLTKRTRDFYFLARLEYHN